MKPKIGKVTSGHTNDRRVIWDLIEKGDAGGKESLYHLSAFTPVFPGAQIGGARKGFGHYHENMWETYLILSGTCVMSLRNLDTGEVIQHLIAVNLGTNPEKVMIPPRTVHRLTAMTETILLIAATGPQSPEDTFEVELAEPT